MMLTFLPPPCVPAPLRPYPSFRNLFKGTPAGIILLVLIVQMCAAVWYTASYIPYGRAMIKGTLCPCLKDLENQDG